MNIEVNPRGVDLSHWNLEEDEVIDWKLFKQYYSFILIKATEGKKVIDGRFQEMWEGAKEYSIPRGAYHYFKFRSGSFSKEQALFFWSVMKNDPGELELWGDFEERAASGYSLSSRRDWIEKFLINLERESGVYGQGVYTSLGWWNSMIANDTNGYTDIPRLMNPVRPRPLWAAHWYVEKPTLPHDWLKRFGSDSYLYHQDTNKENGEDAGIPDTTIDGDWFNGTYSSFNVRYGTNIAPPQIAPIPVPPPTPDDPIVEIAYLQGGETLNIRRKPWGDIAAKTWNREQFEVVSTMGADINPEKYWIKIAGDPIIENEYADQWVASWYTKKA